MSESDCLFCKMAAGEFPVEKLHEDDQVFAIRDINPRAPAHLLIVPKEHIPSAQEIRDSHGALLAQMFSVARSLMEQMDLAERGYRLAINVGPEGGQTIFHLHMHVLGGRRLGAEA